MCVWAERECAVPLLPAEAVTLLPLDASSALTSMPILILNVHSRCNCRCIMCDIWKRETSERVEVADLDRHRASLRKLGVRQVVLTGGEPLLHNDLSALCSFFRAEGIRLTLLTTGLLLHKRAHEVAAYFDDVIVSIDGPREVHDAIRRVPGAFDLIVKGIAAVRARQPRMPIACRTTVQKANFRHLRVTVAAAQSAGFDSISFLAADLTSEAFNRPLLWPVDRQSEIGLAAAEVSFLEREIEELIADCENGERRGYVVESPQKLRRIAGRFREHLRQASPQSPICNAPWVSAVIEVDGSVRPCFFHGSVGNVTSSTLEEVVNGEVAREFRGSLNVAENPICRRCVCSLNYQEK